MNLKNCSTALKYNCAKWAREFFSGAAQVDPYRKGKTERRANFCDYQSACRIDKWTHKYRVLRAAKERKQISVETVI